MPVSAPLFFSLLLLFFHVSTQIPDVIELSLHFTENWNFQRCGQGFPGQRVAKIQILRISPDSDGAKRFSKCSLLQAGQRKDLPAFCNLNNWRSVPGVHSHLTPLLKCLPFTRASQTAMQRGCGKLLLLGLGILKKLLEIIKLQYFLLKLLMFILEFWT